MIVKTTSAHFFDTKSGKIREILFKIVKMGLEPGTIEMSY